MFKCGCLVAAVDAVRGFSQLDQVKCRARRWCSCWKLRNFRQQLEGVAGGSWLAHVLDTLS